MYIVVGGPTGFYKRCVYESGGYKATLRFVESSLIKVDVKLETFEFGEM